MQVPGIVSFFLMHIEEFQSGTVGVEVAQMDGVTMTEAHGIEHLAVVVERSGTPDDFVRTIPVDIADGEVVVTVGIHRIADQA